MTQKNIIRCPGCHSTHVAAGNAPGCYACTICGLAWELVTDARPKPIIVWEES